MNFSEFWKQYKWRIIAVAVGILFTVLCFTINFWRTLLLFLIVGVAYFIGLLLDQGGRARVKEFFRSLFTKS